MARGAKLIDGKQIAADIRCEVQTEVARLKEHGLTPGLAVIIVGEDPASQAYVRNKHKDCAEVGIVSYPHLLPADVTERKLLNLIQRLNDDPKVHGFIVQLPLPKHVDTNKVIQSVAPQKDVDGFHPVNVGNTLIGEDALQPCTPAGVQQLLLRSGYDPAGKHVVIVGRSNIVGKPLAALLVQKAPGANATVTICHSRTKRLPALVKEADIVVAAIGVPEFITARMVKEGAVVIDVGMNRVEDAGVPKGWRWAGDVDFKGVSRKAKAITPVPGGVGPMTRAMLLMNTLKAAKKSAGIV